MCFGSAPVTWREGCGGRRKGSVFFGISVFFHPAGKIFYIDKKVYRALTKVGKDRFEFIKSNSDKNCFNNTNLSIR